MGLVKRHIGELIKIVDERNRNKSIMSFYGININKKFMPTVANIDDVSSENYKVVRKNRFVFSGMQTGRDECIRIGLYIKEMPIIVSPAYTTFEIIDRDIVLDEYFFILFKCKEMDKLGWFYSDSSIRSNLDWDRFCEIEINLPHLQIQKKYVDIYNAILANQKVYENGLDNLKTVITATIEEFKHTAPRIPIGDLLKEIDDRNRNASINNAQGININKEFMPSVANLSETDLRKYKVIRKNQFAYSAMQTGRDECIRIALFHEDEPVIISPAYSVLQVKGKTALAEYIMLWFSRSESDRYGWFISDSSIRASLELSSFYEIEIPLPSIPQQQIIVDFYNARHLIQSNIVKLENILKSICPILIRGAIEEGHSHA
jgi:type I restriction enzyme S subunit